jgi:hypothetical protein
MVLHFSAAGIKLGILTTISASALAVLPAQALTFTSDPQTFGGVLTPGFGPLETPVGTSYIGQGLDFTFGTIDIEAPVPVPGPLPLIGVGAAFSYGRKLRNRIKSSKEASSPMASF